jgi:hypothetical protein
MNPGTLPKTGNRNDRFWHKCEVRKGPLYRRYRGKSGRDSDIVKSPRLTLAV